MHRSHRRIVVPPLVALLLGLAVAAAALAQSSGPAVNWWAVASGGGTSAGGQVTLRDVIGQPFDGPSSSGATLSLNAGYLWGNTSLGQWKIFVPLIIR